MGEKGTDTSPQLDSMNTTAEVGSEGGTPGDLERAHSEVGTGSEATELWRPAERRNEELPRDETPPGRRTP
ncbi:MAG: hypothetical protein JSU08_19195 [Acidobacteria bacterium]|nr:hypothetical protein [Acidobacteriota bacterium]